MADDLDFRMTIEDVFFIRGRGTVVTGVVSQGVLNVDDDLILYGDDYEKQVRVSAIEVFRKRTNSVSAGERVGVFLESITKEEVSRGDELVSTNTAYDSDWWEVEHG